MDEKTIRPVAYIRSDFRDKFGVPRQSGRASHIKSRVVFLKEYAKPESVRGLDGISHIWLIFGFNAVKYTGALTVRPPRLGGNKRVGVFATRSPNRPNGLGLSCVKLDGVEITANGVELLISGADLIDGTPVYDVKPYNPADAIDGATCGFADDFREHALEVEFPEELASVLPESKLAAVKECLKDDPRPSYADDDRVYGMIYGGYNVKFKVSGDVLTVTAVEKTEKD